MTSLDDRSTSRPTTDSGKGKAADATPPDDDAFAKSLLKTAKLVEEVNRANAQEKKKDPTTRERIRQLRAEAQLRRAGWSDGQIDIHRWQRLMVAPVFAAANVWSYGQCAHLVATLASPLATAATTAPLVLGAAFIIRIGLRKVWVKRWSLRYWIAAFVASVWTAITTFSGPTWLMTGLLTLALVLLGSRWWRAYRIPSRMPSAHAPLALEPLPGHEDDVPEGPVTEAGVIVERWRLYLSAKNKPLHNSVLYNHVQLVNGHQFDVELDPDKNSFEDMPVRRGKIAAVMGRAPIDVIIDPHPTGDNSRAVLTILTKNPLAAGIPYQGPRYDNGFIAAGMFADGSGWGSVQVCDHKNSVMNGLVCGDPGAGKSVFLENLGMSALASAFWKVFYCDGSEDADSSSLLNDYMTWSMAGIKGAWAQLRAIKRFLKGRGLENNALGADIRGVNPSPKRMAILWILDEFHRLAAADKKFASEVEQVVRLGRKKGVAVWAATQGLDLSLDFAGISTLRDILTSRNVVAFYSSSTYAHNLISGVNIAPNTLPTGGGYAYLSRPGMNVRAATMRTDFADDMTPWAAQIPDYPWDAFGGRCVQSILDEYRVTPEQARDEALRRLEAFNQALMSGQDVEEIEPELKEQPAEDDVFANLVADMPGFSNLADLERLAAQAEAEGAREEGEEQIGDNLVLKPQHYDVLGAIKAGHTTTGAIVAECTDWSRRTIDNALRDLRYKAKLVDSPRQGHWALTRQLQDA